MNFTIRIKRCKNAQEKPYIQEFLFDGDENSSIAGVLNDINSRNPIVDINGKECDEIQWERSCMVRKCGACAMIINKIPRLACQTFLCDLNSDIIELEPLSKFPVVKDLICDRSVIFDKLKSINLWLENNGEMKEKTHDLRYMSAKCIMCGCCLEVCPNFSTKGRFTGAIGGVNSFRILDEEQEKSHLKELSKSYSKNFFSGCAKSLACQNICPLGLPVEELTSRSNSVAIWKRK